MRTFRPNIEWSKIFKQYVLCLLELWMWNKRSLSRLCVAAAMLGPALPSGAAELAAAASAGHSAWSGTIGQAAQAARRQGALYRVTRGAQTAWLFGTIHVGTTSFYPLAPEVAQALAGATRLVLELDTRAGGAFERAVGRHARYAPGDHIRHHVSADTLQRLTGALHAAGITLASVSHLKPWMLANMLMGLELERSGYRRADGNEFFLLQSAQARGAAVAELESADYQLALFDTLGDAGAEAYLREALDDLASGASLEKARAIINAWSSADPGALDALIPGAIAGGAVTSDFTHRTLLGKRNPEMAAKIARIMQDGEVSFVGVGLFHLLGENGLPQLMAQRGYQVERVY